MLTIIQLLLIKMLIIENIQIGSENPLENPNVAINNTKELLLKGSVVDGLSETQDLLNTPVATEITEDFTPMYLSGDPASPAEFFYENELLRKKISKICVILTC